MSDKDKPIFNEKAARERAESYRGVKFDPVSLDEIFEQSFIGGARWQFEQSRAEIEELREANANCISLLLHENRMREAENRIAELEAELRQKNAESVVLRLYQNGRLPNETT